MDFKYIAEADKFINVNARHPRLVTRKTAFKRLCTKMPEMDAYLTLEAATKVPIKSLESLNIPLKYMGDNHYLINGKRSTASRTLARLTRTEGLAPALKIMLQALDTGSKTR